MGTLSLGQPVLEVSYLMENCRSLVLPSCILCPNAPGSMSARHHLPTNGLYLLILFADSKKEPETKESVRDSGTNCLSGE